MHARNGRALSPLHDPSSDASVKSSESQSQCDSHKQHAQPRGKDRQALAQFKVSNTGQQQISDKGVDKRLHSPFSPRGCEWTLKRMHPLTPIPAMGMAVLICHNFPAELLMESKAGSKFVSCLESVSENCFALFRARSSHFGARRARQGVLY